MNPTSVLTHLCVGGCVMSYHVLVLQEVTHTPMFHLVLKSCCYCHTLPPSSLYSPTLLTSHSPHLPLSPSSHSPHLPLSLSSHSPHPPTLLTSHSPYPPTLPISHSPHLPLSLSSHSPHPPTLLPSHHPTLHSPLINIE